MTPGATQKSSPKPNSSYSIKGWQLVSGAIVAVILLSAYLSHLDPTKVGRQQELEPATNADDDTVIAAAKEVVKDGTYRGSSFVVDTYNNHGTPTVHRYADGNVSQVCIMVDEPTFHDHNWHYDDDGVARWCVVYLDPNYPSTKGQRGIESVSRNGTELGSDDLKIQTWDMQKGYVK